VHSAKAFFDYQGRGKGGSPSSSCLEEIERRPDFLRGKKRRRNKIGKRRLLVEGDGSCNVQTLSDGDPRESQKRLGPVDVKPEKFFDVMEGCHNGQSEKKKMHLIKSLK